MPLPQKDPAGHASHDDAPTEAEYEPAAQAVQAEAPAEAYLPAAQELHEAAPAALYFPAAHAVATVSPAVAQ